MVKLDQPSRTAQGAALHRAAHQLIDCPPAFADPLALVVIGAEAERELREGRNPRSRKEYQGLRAFIAARSRFAEDCLAEAYARGTRQYVLLGAGLDTFAYREHCSDLHVIEVDYPATQAWKRARLAELGINAVNRLTYAGIDFEHETLRDGLARAGFDFGASAFFSWLGVTRYLAPRVVMATLEVIGGFGQGSEIVFDFGVPPERANQEQIRGAIALARRVADVGEPFKSFFDPKALSERMKALGFSIADIWGRDALNARYFAGRADDVQLRGPACLMRGKV